MTSKIRGCVVRMGEKYTEGTPTYECSGEIDQSFTPPFYAMGAFVVPGLEMLKLTSEQLERGKAKGPPKTKRCSCGKKGVPSLCYENEVEGCDMCSGAVCASGTKNWDTGKRLKSGGVCCKCMDGALC